MLLAIPHVLTPEQISLGRQILESAEWVDGRVSAGYQGARVKNNVQLPSGSPAARQVGDMILRALEANGLFMATALPLRVLPPMFNSYSGGQAFGTHIDGAIRMKEDGTVRTDLSCTLFFTGPDEYDGGELVVEDTYGTKSIKLPAGHLILYPSSSLHRVTPVTRGTRLCSFFWLQSMVRDDARRAQLFALDDAIRRLATDTPRHPSIARLTHVYQNLLRQWADV